MKKVMAVLLVIGALVGTAAMASANPNGSIVPFSHKK